MNYLNKLLEKSRAKVRTGIGVKSQDRAGSGVGEKLPKFESSAGL